MAASPIGIAPIANLRRCPLALTSRRIEANRRNASRSTGPRTIEVKARVARNAIKHGFFAAPERWTPRRHRDFEETLAGLRDEFQPRGVLEDGCVVTMAASYVRMAAMLRYENIAALKYHEDCDRELNERNWKMEKQTHFIEENPPLSRIPGDGSAWYSGSTTTRMARWSQSKERHPRHPSSSAGTRGGGEEQNGAKNKPTWRPSPTSVLRPPKDLERHHFRYREMQKQTH